MCKVHFRIVYLCCPAHLEFDSGVKNVGADIPLNLVIHI
jgi:hypothetical protein